MVLGLLSSVTHFSLFFDFSIEFCYDSNLFHCWLYYVNLLLMCAGTALGFIALIFTLSRLPALDATPVDMV